MRESIGRFHHPQMTQMTQITSIDERSRTSGERGALATNEKERFLLVGGGYAVAGPASPEF
jgi:hypothetical protein